MGIIATPDTGTVDGYGTVSEGSSIYDKATGKIIGQAPGGSGGGGGSGDPAVQYYADMLAQGLISVSNVPQSIRNAVVIATNGNVRKSMNTGEITKVAELQDGIDGLYDLKAKISENEDKLGPITGLAAINPWSQSRQIRADIDRVRQKVGKALEGGVLRKEDEIKYKKILSTLTDTPSTAQYKIDQLIADIQTDLDNFQYGLTTGGRYTGESSKPSLDELFK